MRKGVLAIYDYETDYSYRFMDYLNRKGDFELDIMVFTNHISIMEYLEKNTIDVLLVGEDIYLDLLDDERIKTILILSETDPVEMVQQYPSVYKFQSAERIAQTILSAYMKTKQNGNQRGYLDTIDGEHRSGMVIGIVSPNGGSGKSTFAIGLGQALSSDKKVLLMNLEAVPGQYYLGDDKEDQVMGISDLIYYIKQKNKNISLKIKTMIRKIGQLDYILPADHYSDLYELCKEDVVSLMQELKNNCSYDAIILDLGYISDSTFSFLACCDKIFMPTSRDIIAREKEESWLKILGICEGQHIMNRVDKITIPYDELLAGGKYQVNQIYSGKLKEFIDGLAIWEAV